MVWERRSPLQAVGNDRISIMIPGAALEQFSIVVQNAAVQQKHADKPMTSLNKGDASCMTAALMVVKLASRGEAC